MKRLAIGLALFTHGGAASIAYTMIREETGDWYWSGGTWTPFSPMTGQINPLPRRVFGPFGSAQEAFRDWREFCAQVGP